MTLDMWSSSAIVIGFSILVVVLDEYVVKPYRERHWEKKAAAGDPEARELLRIAASAKVIDE